ncbi:Small-subunit processome, Utp12 [Paramyrothecium foliicola]|nr:Small-subunit processome, Utp12 [Paramyrothecium foliicola]
MPMSTKRKAPGKLAAPVVKSSARPNTKSTIDESNTAVSGPDANPASVEMIEISSDADSDEDISDVEDEANAEAANGELTTSESAGAPRPALNGRAKAHSAGVDDSSPNDDVEAEGSDAEATSPSFGELLRGNETIDVPSLLQHDSSNNVAKTARAGIIPPAPQSLTTVLTQALRTDDTDLLESCLHTKDLPTIRNTIERLDSTLAGTLLNKIAARLYRRPGRAGVLMTWVQWTLIAHGGALASQPKVIHGLNGLQKVLAERAKGLNSLLALKGKLDLLEGQMDMRRKMQRASGAITQGEDDDEDDDVIWVEGEPNDLEEKELRHGGASRRGQDMEIDDEDDVLAANGFIDDSDDDEEDDDAVEEDDSDAAEESLDEDEVDHDDVDESIAEDEESDVEAAPPSKVQKVAKSFSKKK